jgi:hypothetical protein
MSISALTDFIAVSGLIGSALYDDKNLENFSEGAARVTASQKNRLKVRRASVRTS